MFRGEDGRARRAQSRRIQHAGAPDRLRRGRRSVHQRRRSADERGSPHASMPRSRVDLLSNQLAIAVPDDRPRTLTSARDLLDPAIRRIAIGDPAAVPAGVYAKQYLADARHLAGPVDEGGALRQRAPCPRRGRERRRRCGDRLPHRHRHRDACARSAGRSPRPTVRASSIPPRSFAQARIRTARAGCSQFLQSPDAMAVFTRAGFLAPASARK